MIAEEDKTGMVRIKLQCYVKRKKTQRNEKKTQNIVSENKKNRNEKKQNKSPQKKYNTQTQQTNIHWGGRILIKY